MNAVTNPLGPLGLLGVIFVTLMLANLSRRLGMVARMPSYYRGFYIASVFFVVALFSHMIRNSAALAADASFPPFLLQPWFFLVTYHLPLALGATVTLILVFYYWRFVFKEQSK